MSSSSSRSFVWPKDSAEQVRFWIPNEWKIVGPQFCCLTYDPEERLLKVVAACDDNDQKEEVLHVIDPDDMIGVKLEVQLREGSNVETKKDEQDTKDDATPRRATNEPANDTLSDTQGQATLHLYCYPRCDYSKGSWLSYCGITSYQHPVRQPTYQRPASSDGDSSQRPAARVAHFQSLVLAPVEDMSQVSSLVSALQQLASDRSLQEKRPTFLILVNPHSGPRKNGWTLCRDTVRPMLEEAGIDTYVVVTAHAKHATELVLQQGLPALSGPVPENWITMEDDFILLWASQVTHASMTNMPSPESTFDDGLFRIFIVRGHVTRLQLIRMLLSLESGGHRHLPGAEFIDCVAYRLEPQSPGSFNDIDGEAVEDGPIQGVVQPQTMQIFGRSSK